MSAASRAHSALAAAHQVTTAAVAAPPAGDRPVLALSPLPASQATPCSESGHQQKYLASLRTLCSSLPATRATRIIHSLPPARKFRSIRPRLAGPSRIKRTSQTNESQPPLH